jgi:hypothetical protein
MSEEEQNKTVISILSNIKKWFSKKKKIARIRVVTPKQSFWVSNPKKIKFWKGIALSQAGALIKDPGKTPGVKITKVVYEDGES